jgi:hypothetical protein
MTQPSPLLTVSDTILWLKVILSAATLVLLYVRYKRGSASAVSSSALPFRARALIVLAVLFSFAIFHNLGTYRSGTFVHYGEMFHYYLGPKYFKELGQYELYNAVIVADAEQDNALAGLPFYTDLRTYQNAPRATAIRDAERLRGLFSKERWSAFKNDVSFFEKATGMPRAPGLLVLLTDHGYNASPVSTLVLGILTNAIPVTQIHLLVSLDVLLVAAMIALVFRTFGFDVGALFAACFFVNILNDHEYISGSLLRYDWLFCIVAAVCLLEKRRYASSSFLLALSAMIKVFPAVLFYGIAVAIFQKWRSTRALGENFKRFILTAGVTGVVLFLLPAVYLGSVLQPWREFSAKTALHDSGVYVNHLGLRGIVIFEPSHLSLERFAETYKSSYTNDIVRHWQDVKEEEFRQKKPIVVVSSLFVLACVTAIIWRRRSEVESVLWPLFLIYTTSYPSHYYYTFLCLFVLLFFRRANSLSAFVPLCLLLIFNIAALVTDHFGPSPIVFYTLVNIYLFVCLAAILAFELYSTGFGRGSVGTVASSSPLNKTRGEVKRRRRQNRAHGNRRGIARMTVGFTMHAMRWSRPAHRG